MVVWNKHPQSIFNLENVVSFFKLLEHKAGMMSMDNHLKGVLVFSGVFDLCFLLIVEIWHDVQKGSGSTPSSTSCQILEVSLASSDLLELCPNLWCNNPREISIFLFFIVTFLLFLPKMIVFSVRYAVISPRSVGYL